MTGQWLFQCISDVTGHWFHVSVHVGRGMAQLGHDRTLRVSVQHGRDRTVVSVQHGRDRTVVVSVQLGCDKALLVVQLGRDRAFVVSVQLGRRNRAFVVPEQPALVDTHEIQYGIDEP